MPKARKSTAKAMPTRIYGRTRKARPASTPAHLPLQADSASASLPSVPAKVPRKRDRTVLPSNSLVRQKVLAIIAMRLDGKTNEQIAQTLNIAENSIKQYMYLAGRNGWLSKHSVDPNDRLEHEIAHKVVRNLDEMLDSDNESRRDSATMKTAEGMLFKKFAEAASQVPPLAVIGIQIVTPPGTPIPIREGTTGGQARWTEGEVIEVPSAK